LEDEALAQSISALEEACRSKRSAEVIRHRQAQAEALARVCLGPEALSLRREWAEFLWVAFVIALAFRSFFLQPFTVPTGSMQPTLNGVRFALLSETEAGIPSSPWHRAFLALTQGVRFYQLTARADGRFDPDAVEPPRGFGPFLRFQRFRLGPATYTIWQPPRVLPPRGDLPPHLLLFAHARLRPGEFYHVGQQILGIAVTAGDHILVDRFTYNFRRPRRGEMVIFSTDGLADLAPGYSYVKRLAGLPGEALRIGDDGQLVVNGVRFEANASALQSAFRPGAASAGRSPSGYLNQAMADRHGGPGNLAPLFPHEDAVHRVGPSSYAVLGDNSELSSDSRSWGDLPRSNVFGRAWFVWWPLHTGWGWQTGR
jgi:signal peptidase I